MIAHLLSSGTESGASLLLSARSSFRVIAEFRTSPGAGAAGPAVPEPRFRPRTEDAPRVSGSGLGQRKGFWRL